MLGPVCVLVRRTSRGFRGIERDHAEALQKCALVEGRDRDLLFCQSQRIAEALNKGEIALAQIYGLHIPVADLDDQQLTRISRIGFARGYNPDEPRLPKGDPHGGEWTTGEASDTATGDSTDGSANGGGDASDTSQGGGDDGSENGDSGEGSSRAATGQGASGSNEATAANGSPSNSGNTPTADDSLTIRWPDAPPPASAPPAQPSNTDPTTLGSPDLGDASPAPQANVDQSSSQDSAGSPSAPDMGRVPPPDIPVTKPPTEQQVNAVLRSLATWLSVAEAVLGAAYELDPEVALVFAAIDATIWLADYAPKKFS